MKSEICHSIFYTCYSKYPKTFTFNKTATLCYSVIKCTSLSHEIYYKDALNIYQSKYLLRISNIGFALNIWFVKITNRTKFARNK